MTLAAKRHKIIRMIGFNRGSKGSKGLNMMHFQPTALLIASLAAMLIAIFDFLSNARPFVATIRLLIRPQKALRGMLSHPDFVAFTVTKYLVRFPWGIKYLLALKANAVRSCTARGWRNLVVMFILPITLQGTKLILSTCRRVEDDIACLADYIKYWWSRHTSILTSMIGTCNGRYDAI